MSRPTRGGPNPMERASKGLYKAGQALDSMHLLARHVLPQWFDLAERFVDQVERIADQAERAIDLAERAAPQEPDDAARGE